MEPVDDHDGDGFTVTDGEVEDGVVTGGGMEDFINLLGADGDGDGIAAGAINDRRNLPGNAEAAGSILAPGLADSGGDGNVFSHDYLSVRGEEARMSFSEPEAG
jgi:hypothetical protein